MPWVENSRHLACIFVFAISPAAYYLYHHNFQMKQIRQIISLPKPCHLLFTLPSPPTWVDKSSVCYQICVESIVEIQLQGLFLETPPGTNYCISQEPSESQKTQWWDCEESLMKSLLETCGTGEDNKQEQQWRGVTIPKPEVRSAQWSPVRDGASRRGCLARAVFRRRASTLRILAPTPGTRERNAALFLFLFFWFPGGLPLGQVIWWASPL